jgi:asparagine synthase (glutamine-hydrolysing)
MSALSGILNFGSGAAPVNEYDLAKLGAALDSRGPDGGFDVVIGNVGMSYRAYYTNRESRLEVQPMVTRQGHVLTWNGRLDNREDLIRQLQLSHTIPDLSIVMAAYLEWEKDCFSRLVGDFCLALWDNRLRVLYLVRDVAGTRALKYHLDRDRIVWSTETAALLALQDRGWEIDEQYIAGAMSLNPIPGLTPYKNIFSVKPAHVVTVSATGDVRSERFWRLDSSKTIKYSTDEQYQEQALEQFSEAIRCRLRSDRPVFAELSGGLDSSKTVKCRRRAWKRCRTYSTNVRLPTNAATSDWSRRNDKSRAITSEMKTSNCWRRFRMMSRYLLRIRSRCRSAFTPESARRWTRPAHACC